MKVSPQFFIQSEIKPESIVSHSHSFSRASRQLHVITSSFDWFTVLFVYFLIGQSDFFGFSSTTQLKPLYVVVGCRQGNKVIEMIE